MKSVPQSKPAGLAEVIRIDPRQVHTHVSKRVCGTMGDSLNSLLEAQANRNCSARRRGNGD